MNNSLKKQACQTSMTARYGNPSVHLQHCFSFLCSSIVDLSVYWQRFQVNSTAVSSCFQRCCLCKAVRRHANYRVQRMGIMMTALGSRSACTVTKRRLCFGSWLLAGRQLLLLGLRCVSTTSYRLG